jgi:D-alanine-D-alanine ligase
MKKKIALIFGGKSVERDISVITAVQTYKALDDKKYAVTPIFIYEGDFYTGNLKTLKDFAPFVPTAHKKLTLLGGKFCQVKKNKLIPIFKPDVVVNCCHGGEGENGTLAGVLEFNDLPHTSPGVLPSAICMDKTVSKVHFDSLFLNTAKSKWFSRKEYEENANEILEMLESRLDYPMIVKPAHLGSSIGINVATNKDELKFAIDVAVEFDDKILVEHKLSNFVEVNCGAFRSAEGIVVSATEQPLSKSNFLTFADKYSTGKMSGGGHIIPAQIGNLNKQVQETTHMLYNKLGLSGVVRFDYLVDVENEKIYINEINTVPGSLAYYLFEYIGIGFGEMMDKIIEQAEIDFLDKKSRRHNFATDILSNFKQGAKQPKLNR